MKNHIPSLSDHYAQLLGLVEPWTIVDIRLDTEAQTLVLKLIERNDATFPCPECGTVSPRYDHGEERTWRHLDTMQFHTTIVARLPRVSCAQHDIKTVAVPWAGAHTRWTLLFEKFSIDVIEGTANITRAMALLRLNWEQVQAIQARAVARGLARRKEETIPHVGIDEKSFLKGHRYASLATDLDRGRVLEVVEERTEKAAEILLETALTPTQRAQVKAGAMDMWPAFMNAWETVMGVGAPIVHDRFHVAGYLGKGVDLVRRKEHSALRKIGDESLTNTKYLWLKNPDSWEREEKATFRSLAAAEFNVARAWALKELFRGFYEYISPVWALRFFNRWYFRATHSRLEPMIAVARTLKRHLAGLLAYCTHRITNAVTEGLNSKIQTIKSNARGFRNFQNYRIAILFHCGKLELRPFTTHSNA